MPFAALLFAITNAAFCADPSPDLAPFLKTPAATRAWGEPVVVPNRGARTFRAEELAGWVAESVALVNPDLPYVFLDVGAFKSYYERRYAAPAFTGWSPRPDFAPGGAYPVAELSEAGKLVILRDFCNDGTFSERRCKNAIHAVVEHGSEQFNQWLRLAQEARTREEFMRKWADGAHYRCREIEVDVNLVLSNAREPGSLEGRRMRSLYDACRRSRWAPDFKDVLQEFAGITRL